MKLFEYVNREYVSPVDLTTLSNTYSTLEQGHQQAVQAKTDLETAIAAMDMNEAEDGFKQNLINNLRQTVADNTVYGNEYGSLDKIITMSGDLVSSPEVLGRLRAQSNYKAFIDDLDKRTDLSANGQAYFRAMNPYQYEDTYDDNGNIIGGTTWEPAKRPTAVVNIADLEKAAAERVAADEGSGYTIMYLDADGKPTTNQEDAVGYGYWVENEWKRVDQDKLAKALQNLIETTPGAKESINQDYDIAEWMYSNLSPKEKDDRNNQYVDDFTDSDGVPLSREGYLKKRINGFLETSSYDINKEKLHFDSSGSGSGSYGSSMLSSLNNDTGGVGGFESPGAVTSNVPITFQYKYGQSLYSDIAYGQSTMLDITKAINPNSNFNSNTDISELQQYVNEHGTDEQKSQFASAYRRYTNAKNAQDRLYSRLEETSDPDARKRAEFLDRITESGTLGDTEWDNQLIASIDRMFTLGNGRRVESLKFYENDIDDGYIFGIFGGLSQPEKDNIAYTLRDFKRVSGDGKIYYELGRNNVKELIWLSTMTKGRSDRSGVTDDARATWLGAIKDRSKTSSVALEDKELDFMATTGGIIEANLLDTYKPLYDIIQTQKNKNDNLLNDIDAGETVTMDNLNYNFESFDYNKLWSSWQSGATSTSDYNALKKQFDDNVKIQLANFQGAQNDIYEWVSDGKKGSMRQVTNTDDRNKISLAISKAVTEKKNDDDKSTGINISAAHVPGLGNGVNVTYFDSKGKQHKVFINGFLDVNTERVMESDMSLQATDEITLLPYTKGQITMSTNLDFPSLGTQVIRADSTGSQSFTYQFGQQEFTIGKEAAIALDETFKQLCVMKDNLYQLNNTDITQSKRKLRDKNMQNAIDDAATRISQAVNNKLSVDFIKNALYKDLGITTPQTTTTETPPQS